MVAWFLGRMISSNISVSWGFVDQVTDNIQIEKKKENFDIFSSRVISLSIDCYCQFLWMTYCI